MYKIDDKVNEKEVIGKFTVKQLEEIFKEYVGDKEALNEESLQLLIKEKLEHNITKRQVSTLIRSIDIDGNGEIEFNEFLEFMRKLDEQDEQDEEALKEVFMLFDRDEKGYLTPESVYHIFLSIGEKIKLEDITNILKENDIDGDGNLNFQDFKMLMHNGLEELNKKNPNSILLNLNNCINDKIAFTVNKNQREDNNNILSYLSGINSL